MVIRLSDGKINFFAKSRRRRREVISYIIFSDKTAVYKTPVYSDKHHFAFPWFYVKSTLSSFERRELETLPRPSKMLSLTEAAVVFSRFSFTLPPVFSHDLSVSYILHVPNVRLWLCSLELHQWKFYWLRQWQNFTKNHYFTDL